MNWFNKRRNKAMSEGTGSATPAAPPPIAGIESPEEKRKAAPRAAPSEQPKRVQLRTVEDAPLWFVSLLVHMLALYPAAQVHPNAPIAWWFHLRGLGPLALEAAFAEAPRQCDALTVPSAEIVRRLAEQWTQEQQQIQEAGS
jgi:hypothetical protein